MTRHDNPGDEDYYTVRQAADKLGVTQQRVRQLCVDENVGENVSEKLRGIKRAGAWLIHRSAVHERFATKPPKIRAGQEKALEVLRDQLRELREENRNLAVQLAVQLAAARRSEADLREEAKKLPRILEEHERELREERKRAETHRKDAQKPAEDVALLKAKVERLEAQLREYARRDEPLGANRPRLGRGPEDGDARRRQAPPPGGGGR